jgi:hypothetical protein
VGRSAPLRDARTAYPGDRLCRPLQPTSPPPVADRTCSAWPDGRAGPTDLEGARDTTTEPVKLGQPTATLNTKDRPGVAAGLEDNRRAVGAIANTSIIYPIPGGAKLGVGALGNTDRYDIKAIELAAAWGWQQEVFHVPLRRCARPFCGGTIIFGDCCLLCARSPLRAFQGLEPEWTAMLNGASAKITVPKTRRRWRR